MAKAKASSTERVVVKEVTETEDIVELTLTREEALTLFAVLYRVGGSSERSHRKEIESVVESLERIYPEIRWGSHEYDRVGRLLEGHLIFEDTPNG